MTSGEAQIRQAVTLIQSTFPSGSGDWARKRFDAWVAALVDLPGEAVLTGAKALVRDWTDGYGKAPMPGHLRERAVIAQRRVDAGDTSERGNGVRFLEAEPWPDEPEGIVRYVVIQPDGTRRPKSGRVLGEGRGPAPLHVAGVPQVNRPGRDQDWHHTP